MIKHFEPQASLPPERKGFQLAPALEAGLIAGVVLLLIPRGSPWAGVSFFSAVVMGRPVPVHVAMVLPVACVIHLILSEIYAVIIALFINNLVQAKAVITAAIIGLVLYLANLAVVSSLLPEWRGYEPSVIFTHAVFGLIVGGAYRGLLKRKPQAFIEQKHA